LMTVWFGFHLAEVPAKKTLNFIAH